MFKSISLLITIFLISTIPIQSQEDKYELNAINFKGNEWFSGSDLESVIQSKENPWWFYRFLNSFTPLGSPPEYFDSTAIPIDLLKQILVTSLFLILLIKLRN